MTGFGRYAKILTTHEAASSRLLASGRVARHRVWSLAFIAKAAEQAVYLDNRVANSRFCSVRMSSAEKDDKIMSDKKLVVIAPHGTAILQGALR
jgi:hypothetical protein